MEPGRRVPGHVGGPGRGSPRQRGVSPDGELATLQDYLRNYRLTLLMKCDGLDAEQLARRSVPPSTMSLLGLLRHLAEAERDWRGWIEPGGPLPKVYGARDADFEGAVADQASVDAAYADLAREQAATDAVLAEHPDLGTRLGERGIAVRELLVHRIEEYALALRPRGFAAGVHRRPRGSVSRRVRRRPRGVPPQAVTCGGPAHALDQFVDPGHVPGSGSSVGTSHPEAHSGR